MPRGSPPRWSPSTSTSSASGPGSTARAGTSPWPCARSWPRPATSAARPTGGASTRSGARCCCCTVSVTGWCRSRWPRAWRGPTRPGRWWCCRAWVTCRSWRRRRSAPRRSSAGWARQDGSVTEADRLQEAWSHFYWPAPDEFVERRGALAARARSAGQAPAAKQIAALRKPTRSAWVVNRLVRADPGVTAELAELGEELRAAQDSLDGSAIRELSQQRRELIESLVRRAFTVVGVSAPPAAIRDEVTATLSAALADQQFADTLAAGALVRAVQAEGFGPVGRPTLTVVRGGGSGVKTAGTGREAGGARAPRGKTAADARSRAPAAPSAEQLRAERERRHRAAAAEAEQAASEASRAADAATAAEHELEATGQRLGGEVGGGREALASARSQARRARTRQRSAQQALDRLRG